jgi:hypothetical protein
MVLSSVLMAVVSVAVLTGVVYCGGAIAKTKRIWVALTLGLLCIVPLIIGLFLLPMVFLLPQDAGTILFGSLLRTGMTRSDVDNLRKWTFGTPGAGYNSHLKSIGCGGAESACIHYTNEGSICFAGGVVFGVAFDRQQRVSSWEQADWGDGC